ncbi:MAG: hypothetical protein HY343_10655, partial [Lentisphaerae bacterium]|nr:hypothetical protein [Lentisphaerota bacterium]
IMLSQVLIEVIIIEVSLNKSSETGVDWLQRSMIAYNRKQGNERSPFLGFAGTSREGTAGTINDGSMIRTIDSNPSTAGSGLTYYLTQYDMNLNMVVNLLAASSTARIMATPVILTTDNKEAKIIVGEKRPIVTSTSLTTGGNQQSTYEYTSIGIQLTVTPHINRREFVMMDIAQKIDNVGGEELIDGNKVPIITTREFGANVSVSNRQTIIIGGLVSADKGASESHIPIIGSIPIVNLLFRSDSKSQQRRELLVLITPYVMTTPEEVQAETLRRHGALPETKGLVQKGWSESAVAEPTKAQEKARKKEEKRKGKERQKAEKENAGKPASEPAADDGEPAATAEPVATDQPAATDEPDADEPAAEPVEAPLEPVSLKVPATPENRK